MKFKWWIIFKLLSNNEKSLFLSHLSSNNDKLERFSDCLGETYFEYIQELERLRLYIK